MRLKYIAVAMLAGFSLTGMIASTALAVPNLEEILNDPFNHPTSGSVWTQFTSKDTQDQLFSLNDTLIGSSSVLLTLSGGAMDSGDALGIYEKESAVFTSLQLLDSTSTISDSVMFTVTAAGAASYRAGFPLPTLIDYNVNFTHNVFGFYFSDASNGTTVYSESALNPLLANSAESDLVATFNLDGIGRNNTGEWVIAFENGANPTGSFNELVIQVSGVDPVPEPATFFMVGIGLAGLFLLKQRVCL